VAAVSSEVLRGLEIISLDTGNPEISAIVAEISHFFVKQQFNRRANRRNCYIFWTTKKNGPPDTSDDPFQNWTVTLFNRRD
jgi:hypothetical protein